MHLNINQKTGPNINPTKKNPIQVTCFFFLSCVNTIKKIRSSFFVGYYCLSNKKFS